MRSQKHPSPLWLWWRRRVFHLRRIPFIWCLLFCICILFVTTKIPNPFSSKYTRISIVQDVHWSSLSDVLKAKEKTLSTDSLSKEVKFIKHGKDDTSRANPFLILLYTTIFLNKRYCSATVDQIFGETCPSKNRCQWTCDRQKLSQADAIIFHAYDVQFYKAPVPNRTETKPKAIWILWSDEPPSMVDYKIFNSVEFNWTISYKSNSEVSLGTYGLLTKRKTVWSDKDYNEWINQQFSDRLNGALWFVSNCDAKKRLEYYHNLYHEPNITVEGYGRCVDSYPMHFCKAQTQCERDYMSEYKYYLSFESTTCRDYITEKFFKALYYGLIPVVYGPERKDYNRIIPSNSYIHINDFDNNMNKLANYLQNIHMNLSLYSMYHQWRKKYEVIIDGRALERIRLCELCERLTKTRQDDVTYYIHIEEFYEEKC